MSARHTPGPWYRNIRPATKYPVIFAGRNTHVASVYHDKNLSAEEIEANHDLMTAAPAMLSVLEAIAALEPKSKADSIGLLKRARHLAKCAIKEAGQ